ncbi:TaqI-like C-terminal specificity domain-containing protein [Empedobacter brevis]|uniref:TaqI-like C-terminal specificity domain-containing protein n=1 Tax=Empedobacter brevis TaxID=247 RepID=UPI0039B0D26F
MLRGRDIKKYSYDFADLWLITSHNGIKEKGIKPIDINNYPAIKAHLDQFYSQLEKRSDKGDTPYNLRNCAYMDDFNSQKIAYIEIMTDNPEMGYEFPCFTLDYNESVILNTGYIMNGDINDLKYILGFLNSKIGRFLVKIYTLQLQQNQYRMLSQYVTRFPVPLISNKHKMFIINIIEGLSVEKNKNSEEQLDKIFYKILTLNSEEIEFIES